MTDPRRIAVLDGGRCLDLVLPLGGTLGEALDVLGLDLSGPDVALVVDGRRQDPSVRVTDLADGTLLTVVDLAQVPPAERRAVREAQVLAWDAPWWAMVAVAAVAVVTGAGGPHARWVAVVLAAGALAAGLVTVLRVSAGGTGHALRMAGPGALAVAAVTLAAPRTAQGATQLVLFAGGLAVGMLLVLGVVGGTRTAVRAALGAGAVVVLASALVWGVVLWLGWSVQAGAAITAGAVPLAVRALPSALLNLADGYFIDYRQFMRMRWAVRGGVPADPGQIDRTTMRDQVEAAVAGRTAGVVALSVLGALAIPAAVPGPGASTVVRAGALALLTCYALGLGLLARSAGSVLLHWVPRASALVAVAVATGLLVRTLDGVWLVGAAGIAVLAGVVAVGVVVPAGRGIGWLVGSRTADIVEALAVALSLPAGLLAADAIDQIRALMSA